MNQKKVLQIKILKKAASAQSSTLQSYLIRALFEHLQNI